MVLFLGRHEQRKGLNVLLDAFARLRAARRPVGGRRRAGAPRCSGGGTPSRTGCSWLGLLSDDEVAVPTGGGGRAVRALAAGRVLRHGAPRGHGGRAAPWWPPTSRATGWRRAATPPSCPPATPAPWPARWAAPWPTPSKAWGSPRCEARKAATEYARAWSMDTLAERYLDVYERAIERLPRAGAVTHRRSGQRLSGRPAGRRLHGLMADQKRVPGTPPRANGSGGSGAGSVGRDQRWRQQRWREPQPQQESQSQPEPFQRRERELVGREQPIRRRQPARTPDRARLRRGRARAAGLSAPPARDRAQGSGREPVGSPAPGSRPRSGPPRSAVALAPPPPLDPLDVPPSLGAPQVFPAEVAANRRRVITLCAVSAVLPALAARCAALGVASP